MTDKKCLTINFAGNLDLYLIFYEDNKDNIRNLKITKDNYFLYHLFDELYEDIKNAKNVFNEKLNDDVKNSVFVDNKVRWVSDNDQDENNILEISKTKDEINLVFTKTNFETKNSIICVCNSGSRYNPFNMYFMKLFKKMQEYDPNYEQVHIEEYMFKKTMKNNFKNHN